MNNEREIIQAIAGQEPGIPSEHDGDRSCFWCYAYLEGGEEHADDCTFRKAERWLLANPVSQSDNKAELMQAVGELMKKVKQLEQEKVPADLYAEIPTLHGLAFDVKARAERVCKNDGLIV